MVPKSGPTSARTTGLDGAPALACHAATDIIDCTASAPDCEQHEREYTELERCRYGRDHSGTPWTVVRRTGRRRRYRFAGRGGRHDLSRLYESTAGQACRTARHDDL